MEITKTNRVVLRFKNGTIIKGATGDFFPNKNHFHLIEPGGKRKIIDVNQLKAIFFVKDLIGNKFRPDQYNSNGVGTGRQIEVEFYDNEVIVGYAVEYSPERQGFFMTPIDSLTNNERIFIVRNATKNIKFL